MVSTVLKRPRVLFALIVVAFGVYAAAFIFRTSTLVEKNSYIPETKRYYVLFDDAMVSMRYAKNLANGYGLVWNPGGERVEGFTNPLWVGYMTIYHLLGIDESKTSLYIQVTGALLLVANLVVVKKIADRVSGNPLVGLGAAFFTAFYLPLNVWSLQGTEVSVLALIVSLATWWVIKALDEDRFALAPYLLLGFSTLIRMDMAVSFAAVATFLFFADRRRRLWHAIAAPLILAGFILPQEAWRRWYYHEWLPNTYYLKMQGYPFVLRITQGFEVTGRFFARAGVIPFGIFIFRRDRQVRLLAWMFVAQVLYNIYVGGDAWEWHGGANRYVSIAIPLFFILLWHTLVELFTWLMAAARQPGTVSSSYRLKPAALRAGFALFAVFLFLDMNYTNGTATIKELLLIDPPMLSGENKMRVEQALLLKALTTDSATVTVAAAGIIPYFADRPYIDLLGKNDKVIAHMQAQRQYTPEFLPGHMKWDYSYSIGQFKPDVVLELWLRAQDAGQYMDDNYLEIWFPPANRTVFMLKDSPNIYWDRLFGSG
jgi:hypothetical protein